MSKITWPVMVLNDNGAETCYSVADQYDGTLAERAARARKHGIDDAIERGVRVASARIEWSDVAEQLAEDLKNATDCIDELQDCFREDARGWVYGDEDEFRATLQRYGYE